MAKIIQIVPVFVKGDAIGNEAIVINELLRKNGYDAEIWTTSTKLEHGCRVVRPFQIKQLQPDDLAILHFSTLSEANTIFGDAACKKVMMYHNVTPGDFFRDFNPMMADACDVTRKQLAQLADKIDYALADSDFNKQELVDLGYRCPIDVVPIYIEMSDYEREPNMECVRKHESRPDTTTVLFTGRIAPNKCQEDIMAAFTFYRKHYNPNAYLYLAGSYKGNEAYFDYLNRYNVVHDTAAYQNITGKQPFKNILAYYHTADVMVCMSEHEGFCVPLVEAMYFDVPIIAYDSTAIAETLGGSGILVDKKDPAYIAAIINELMTNDSLRCQVILSQRKRLEDFKPEKTKAKLLTGIEKAWAL